MFEVNIAVLLIVCLIGLVAIGVHIAIALGMTSALGIFLVTGADIYAFRTVQTMLAATAYEAIRDYVFAVIPLFLLMGEFISKSGTVTDVYRGLNRLLRKIPGRLAIATVLGNALFSFVTGVSIASAATCVPRFVAHSVVHLLCLRCGDLQPGDRRGRCRAGSGNRAHAAS